MNRYLIEIIYFYINRPLCLSFIKIVSITDQQILNTIRNQSANRNTDKVLFYKVLVILRALIRNNLPDSILVLFDDFE
jgi:hypothetical protein